MKRVIVFGLVFAMLISSFAVGVHPTIVSAMQMEPKKDLKIGMIVPTLGGSVLGEQCGFCEKRRGGIRL